MSNLDTKYLYHYTSMPTLFNIFDKYNTGDKTIVFRASHIDFLNDPFESKLYSDAINKFVYRKFQSNNLIGSPSLSIDNFNFLKIFREELKLKGKVVHNFIISFSKEIDNLVMYRTYSSNAQGVAIEFDYQKLEHISSNELDYWIDCVYKSSYDEYYDESINNPEVITYINDIISQYKSLFPLFQKGLMTQNPDQIHLINLSDEVVKRLTIYPAKFKHNAYENEREFRFVTLKSLDGAQFFHRNGLMIPYVNVDIPIEAITRITIAPCANADIELSKKSLEYFFESKGLSIPIEISKQPYTIR